MTAYTKIGGEWKEFDPNVKVGGAWKTVDNGYVKVNGEWKEFYQGFDFILSTDYHLPDYSSQIQVDFSSTGTYTVEIYSANDSRTLSSQSVTGDGVVIWPLAENIEYSVTINGVSKNIKSKPAMCGTGSVLDPNQQVCSPPANAPSLIWTQI